MVGLWKSNYLNTSPKQTPHTKSGYKTYPSMTRKCPVSLLSQSSVLNPQGLKKVLIELTKLDGVGPFDNRPSTTEAPPIGNINPFSKIAVTLEPVV